MFANKSTNDSYIFLTEEEQIQLKIIDNIANDAKKAGHNSCTWYNLKENVVKQLEQFGYTVTSEKYTSIEIFTIYLPNN